MVCFDLLFATLFAHGSEFSDDERWAFIWVTIEMWRDW